MWRLWCGASIIKTKDNRVTAVNQSVQQKISSDSTIKNKKLLDRMLTIFFIVTGLAVILGGMGIVTVRTETKRTREIYEILLNTENFVSARLNFQRMTANINEAHINGLNGNINEATRQKNNFTENRDTMYYHIELFDFLAEIPTVIDMLTELKEIEVQYSELADNFFELCKSSNSAELLIDKTVISELADKESIINNIFSEIITKKTQTATDMNAKTNTLKLWNTIIILGLLVIVVVFMILYSILDSKIRK